MLEKIKPILKKNETLYYYASAVKRRKDKDVRNFLTKKELQKFVMIENLGEWGKHPVYVIEYGGPALGFFAMIRFTLDQLSYADMLSVRPYIKFSDDCLYAVSEKILGSRNPFEYYFIQPSGLSEYDARENPQIRANDKYREYIYTGFSSPFLERNSTYSLSEAETELYTDRAAYVCEKYLKFNSYTENYLSENIQNKLGNKKTLGVHARGGEWRIPVENHPVAISLDEHISHVKSVFEKYGFEQIFLASDEKDAIDAFTKAFGDKVVFYKDVFRANAGQWVLGVDSSRKNHNYLLGLEVLRDAETLVHCDGLIAGLSNISLYVQIKKKVIKEKFEYISIADNGINKKGRTLKEVTEVHEKHK